MSGIVWLASYPKSGNTWVRTVLTNYLANNNEPADINALYGGPEAGFRGLFDDIVELPSSDLTRDEIERYRPELYARFAAESNETLYVKIHDACVRTSAGEWLISEATQAILYIVRNPFDVAVSFSHYKNSSIDETIDHMADNNYSLGQKHDGLMIHLREKLLTWSGHVFSWLDQDAFPIHVMRYEDMHLEPLNIFKKAFVFAGLNVDDAHLQQAIDFSQFSILQEQEKLRGFQERWRGASGLFFRKGKAGSWRDILTPAQVDRIVETHFSAMLRLGYISETGEILC